MMIQESQKVSRPLSGVKGAASALGLRPAQPHMLGKSSNPPNLSFLISRMGSLIPALRTLQRGSKITLEEGFLETVMPPSQAGHVRASSALYYGSFFKGGFTVVAKYSCLRWLQDRLGWRLTESEAWPCHSPVGKPWTSYLTSLCLSSLICKRELIEMIPTSEAHGKILQLTCVKC